jgi:N-acetylmuramoyl-L-alanine amidase
MLLSSNTDCSTGSCRGLDAQLIHQMLQIKPNLLVRIDNIPNLILGDAVHPWVQPQLKSAILAAMKLRPGVKLVINSAYRTIVGQALLRSHYECNRCGIRMAAKPGLSNHNNASAIDIEDSVGWRSALLKVGFRWQGAGDPMHYEVSGIDIRPYSVRAFQMLHNYANPVDRLTPDGNLGMLTLDRLMNAPVEGYPNLPPEFPQRILKYTYPLQAGEDVGKLQLGLRAAGIKVERADKIFGEATQIALKEFQLKTGMSADGVAGKSTLLALYSDLAPAPIA